MSSLLSFGVMGLAGIAAAFIYDMFRVSGKAANRVCDVSNRLKHLPTLFKSTGDILSVIAAFVLFLLTAYVCSSGVLRSYIILGFVFGIVLYAGFFTKITGTLAYGIFFAFLYVARLLFWRVPKRIYSLFRKHTC